MARTTVDREEETPYAEAVEMKRLILTAGRGAETAGSGVMILKWISVKSNTIVQDQDNGRLKRLILTSEETRIVVVVITMRRLILTYAEIDLKPDIWTKTSLMSISSARHDRKVDQESLLAKEKSISTNVLNLHLYRSEKLRRLSFADPGRPRQLYRQSHHGLRLQNPSLNLSQNQSDVLLSSRKSLLIIGISIMVSYGSIYKIFSTNVVFLSQVLSELRRPKHLHHHHLRLHPRPSDERRETWRLILSGSQYHWN